MSDDLIELIAPAGTDEANHGTQRYRVDNTGRIWVPREVAFHLINAGFKHERTFQQPPPPDPDPAPVDPPPAPPGAFLMPEPSPAPARTALRSMKK